jgi:hypothetical protein
MSEITANNLFVALAAAGIAFALGWSGADWYWAPLLIVLAAAGDAYHRTNRGI